MTNPSVTAEATALFNRIPRRVLLVACFVVGFTILFLLLELQIEVGRLRRITKPYLISDNPKPQSVEATASELDKVMAANRDPEARAAISGAAMAAPHTDEKNPAPQVVTGPDAEFKTPDKIIS